MPQHGEPRRLEMQPTDLGRTRAESPAQGHRRAPSRPARARAAGLNCGALRSRAMGLLGFGCEVRGNT